MGWGIGSQIGLSLVQVADILNLLEQSNYHGRVCSKTEITGFENLLHKDGVIDLFQFKDKGDFEIGEEILLMLSRFGFITPRLIDKVANCGDAKLIEYTQEFDGLSGLPYELTPNGRALIEVDAYPKKQEVVLRALLNYCLPSVLEPGFEKERFYPLRVIIDVMLMLKQLREEPCISLWEMANIVRRESVAKVIVSEIREYRDKRKGFAADFEEKNTVMRESCGDFCDLTQSTFRWLLATGLFRTKFGGIHVYPVKAKMVELIQQTGVPKYAEETYLFGMWRGAKLPTDDKEQTMVIVKDLCDQLNERLCVSDKN